MVPDSDESGNLTLLPNRPKHLVSLVETIEIPESFDAAQKIRNREHPAREQPENMKMQFVPFGFYSAEDYMQMNGMEAESLSMPAAEEPAKKKRKVSADVETPVSPKADKKKAKKEKKDKGKKEKDTDVDVEMTPASPKADKKAAKKERREKKPKHKKSKE
ncbi:hypothetical protein FBU59_004368 [Linderina macrospora]|uniref:Uncharacterized protein n=1 Tax=Linderina macrospora TaxID=4868 RepID=A0ACC1J5P1_9FUNG|nr:hypothetical protein FBU59_004368 [Linderina macrospora]